jgi:hypothetical protein
MKEKEMVRKPLTSASRPVATVAILFVFCSVCPAQEKPFDPAKQQMLSARSQQLLVTLNKREPCHKCPSTSRFRFQVRDLQKATSREFVLENETAQVDEIHVSKHGKLAIFGRVLANTSMVTIVDTRTWRPIDSFFCFRPAISPDKRFLVFEKVYPAHFQANISSLYLIYDIKATPEANRNQGIPVENRIDVGRPIFPPGAQNMPGDNINVPLEKQHMMASNKFYWSKDSSRVMFADSAGGENALISVDISEWPKKLSVHTTPLETDKIVDEKKCQDFEGRLEKAFHVIDITPKNDKTIELRFRSHIPPCLRLQTLRVTLPK